MVKAIEELKALMTKTSTTSAGKKIDIIQDGNSVISYFYLIDIYFGIILSFLYLIIEGSFYSSKMPRFDS